MEWTPARMRLFREVGLCQSQQDFAKTVGFAMRTIGNAERGTHPPSLALRRALDHALEHATDAQRDRFHTAQDQGAASLDNTSVAVTPIEGSGRHYPHLSTALALSAAIHDGARWAVTEATARDLLAISTHYRQGYRSMPAVTLLEASHAHLSLILSLQPAWQTPQVRRVLLRSAGESAVLTAVLLFADLARYSDAVPYLALAQDTAQENGDPDLTAVLLACRAFLTSFSGGSPTIAVDFAEAAVNVSIDEETSPTTQGWVAAVSSEQLAVLGEEQRSRSRLDVAREAVAEQEPDSAFAGVGTFDLAKATAYQGGNLVRLGRYDDAVAVLTVALAALTPTMHRHRCTALIDRAEAHLTSSQVDASCEDATAALSIAAHTGHTLSVQRVHRLAAAALPTHAAAARRLWADVLAATVNLGRPSPSR